MVFLWFFQPLVASTLQASKPLRRATPPPSPALPPATSAEALAEGLRGSRRDLGKKRGPVMGSHGKPWENHRKTIGKWWFHGI